jgi:hypothetical protein
MKFSKKSRKKWLKELFGTLKKKLDFLENLWYIYRSEVYLKI